MHAQSSYEHLLSPSKTFLSLQVPIMSLKRGLVFEIAQIGDHIIILREVPRIFLLPFLQKMPEYKQHISFSTNEEVKTMSLPQPLKTTTYSTQEHARANTCTPGQN